jgi:hypothetical protein
MTKLCAEALGMGWLSDGPPYWPDGRLFDPLNNDAQALALVKKFDTAISKTGDHCRVTMFGADRWFESTDLNRAIVECVAKMRMASLGDKFQADVGRQIFEDVREREVAERQERCATLEDALEYAADALYNAFEPDNQSQSYKVVLAALARARAKP